MKKKLEINKNFSRSMMAISIKQKATIDLTFATFLELYWTEENI